MTRIESTIEKLHQLRLNNMADSFADAVEKEKDNNHGFLWLLDYLLDLEHESRWQRSVENRIKASRLIDIFLPTDFDFKFDLSRQKCRSLIMHLLECDFIHENKDIIFIGNPGTGNYRKFLFMESIKRKTSLF